MRLLVVFAKYWLAILRKEKVTEFRSSNHSLLLSAGQCLLFALSMSYRRQGKDTLVCARVSDVQLLDVDQARAAYPREAEDCNLADLAAKWGVTSVRCIVLDKDSIRIADEVANLSTGCQGIVHQFALKTGVPHFCHVSDLGKTVSFTLPDGRIVHHTFRKPACDSRERSTDESTLISEAAQSAEPGNKAGDPRDAPNCEKGDDRLNP
jgi:hypothetical protein